MVTEETIRHRDNVSEVWEELDSFLKEKAAEYTAKLNAPYSSDEPTEEELRAKLWDGSLSVAYAKVHGFVLSQETKYMLETNRMLSRSLHELKTIFGSN